MTTLPPYPENKPSGVTWLGEIPLHWTAQRLRTVAEMRVSNVDKIAKDGELPVRLCNYTDVYKHDRIRAGMAFMPSTATDSEIERFRLAAGDVLITKDSESWNDIGVPALVEESADDLISGYHLALLRPIRDRLLGGYLLRALQSRPVSYQFHVEANGVTRYGLSHAAIKAVAIPLPTLPEQAAIVRFLDHFDRRFRRYIAAKRKLIVLLNEQKQVVIHRAVTRGLDRDVHFKSSGVPWLGDVPEHWDVVRIVKICRMESGHTPTRANPAHWRDDNDIPWVSLNDTKQLDRVDYIDDTRLHINELGLQNSSARLLPPGVVVFTRDANVGKAAITTRPMAVSQHLIAWVCGPRIDNRYLLRVVYAMKAELASLTFGATIPTIGMDDIRKMVTPVPPLEEQVAIAAFLSSYCERLDRAVATVRADVDALVEYRTRLIADVVSGKLDVRDAAARLPDDIDEPLDEPEQRGDDGEPGEEANLSVADEAVA